MEDRVRVNEPQPGRVRKWLTTKQGLLIRKASVAFLVGFLGVLIPAFLQILDALTKGEKVGLARSTLIALVAGAFAAGIRTVLALSPLNLSSTDALTSLKNPASEVLVTTEPAPPTTLQKGKADAA